MEYYGLEGDEAEVTINVANGHGSVQLNTIAIDQYPWTGYYLENLPISITAIPNPGFKFIG